MKITIQLILALAALVAVQSTSVAQPPAIPPTAQTSEPQTSEPQTSKPQTSDPQNAETHAAAQALPPLKRVVFYNSGVAHMQHAGTVTGNAKLEIRFSSHDVDDVLKSLVFEDRGGGYVRAVEYQPAPNPEDVAANDFAPMTLAQLLQKYRGESVEAQLASNHARKQMITGTIFGLENRAFADETAEVLVLLNEQGMQSVRLNDLSHVQFSNQTVRDELKLAMTGVSKSRKANQKKLDLLFTGEGEREVGFAYVVDAPIWRMTYRLSIFPNNVLLQGWTHINNVTGVDWKDVLIELRSGQPQTFHAELFAPVLVERPSIGLDPFDLADDLTLVRQFYGFEPAERFMQSGDRGGAGIGGDAMGGMGGGMGGGMMGGSFGGGGGGRGGATASPSRTLGIDSSTAFRELAKLDRASQMVRFQLNDPVNLASGKSAALPVFSEELPNRVLSVVKHDAGEDLIAIRAVELTNKTNFAFVPGPVNVTDDGDFVGDGRLERVAVGAISLLPFAIDRPISIARHVSETKSRLKDVEFAGTSVRLRFEQNYKVHFDVKNEDSEQRLMQIEYRLKQVRDEETDHDPFEEQADTTESNANQIGKFAIDPPPTKADDSLVTYEFPVAGLTEKRQAFDVTWQTTQRKSLRTASSSDLKQWLGSGAQMTELMRAKLTALLELNAQESAHRKKISRLLSQQRAFTAEQSRVRENLQVLGSETSNAERFLERLNQTETGILELNTQLVDAEKVTAALESRRKELIGD